MNTERPRRFDWTKLGIRAAIGIGGLLALALVGLIVFRIFCVTFVDNYELGYVYDKLTGKIEVLERTGWIVRLVPLRYKVHGVDLRPYQVQMNANSRVLNAKLVQFNPNGLLTFIEWHGRDAGDLTANMVEILRSYAFNVNGGSDCPFLTVINELEKDKKTGPQVGTLPQRQ